MSVDGRRDCARIGPRLVCQLQSRVAPPDQPDILEAAQAGANAPQFRNIGQIRCSAAQDRLDRTPADTILSRSSYAASGRKACPADRGVPASGILFVLEQPVGKLPDRTDPQAEEHVSLVFGKSLEVAAKRAVCSSTRQRILRSGEMIKANGLSRQCASIA
jgi:hypothetical protein